jgi:glycosyltransferase involved in cell wall biosynthesis
VSKSTGKYITFLDSDDEYLPKHLEARANILVKNPQIEILHGGFQAIGSQYVPDYFNQSKKIHISKIVLGSTFFIQPNVFKKIGKFKNLPYGEDTDFFYRAKENNIKKLYIHPFLDGRDTLPNVANVPVVKVYIKPAFVDTDTPVVKDVPCVVSDLVNTTAGIFATRDTNKLPHSNLVFCSCFILLLNKKII